MKTVLFIANYSYPSNSAYSTRINSFCQIFNDLGFNVTILCHNGMRNDFDFINKDMTKILNFAPAVTSFQINIRNFLVSKYTLKSIIEKHVDHNEIDIILIGGGYNRIFKTVHKIYNKKNIPVVVEVCEWYERNQIAFGFLSPLYWDNRLALWATYRKADGLIGISEYLVNYYKSSIQNSIRVPAILDTKKVNFTSKSSLSNKIVISYAGFPAKNKDLIKNVIIAIYKESKLQKSILLNIIGSSREKIEKLLGRDKYILDQLKENVFFLGKLNHEEVNHHLIKSDFSILVRPDKRYARAGFPTKFAESMAAGLPVISNLTGDIGLYLKDMYNGIIINSDSVIDCIDSLERVSKLSAEQITILKINARETAIENFDYKVFKPIVENFLCELGRKSNV